MRNWQGSWRNGNCVVFCQNLLSFFLPLLRIRESEFRVGNGEGRRPQTEPKKAVEQQDSGKRNQPGVAFKGSPVL